jgi:uncharacterized protein YqeY
MSEGQLTEALTRAMKARDMPRVYVLRGLLTAVKNLTVERRGGAIRDDDVVQIVRREIRKREEAERFAAQAGRQDHVEQNRAERALLEEYAPPSLDEARLEAAIRELARDAATRSMGAIMSGLKARFAGQFDGRQASEIARRVLAEAPST